MQTKPKQAETTTDTGGESRTDKSFNVESALAFLEEWRQEVTHLTANCIIRSGRCATTSEDSRGIILGQGCWRDGRSGGPFYSNPLLFFGFCLPLLAFVVLLFLRSDTPFRISINPRIGL